MRRLRAEEDSADGRDPGRETPLQLSTARASKRPRVSIMEAFQSLDMNGSRASRELDGNASAEEKCSMEESKVANDEESSVDSSDIELLSDEQIAQRKVMYSLLHVAATNNSKASTRKDVVDERLERMIRETRRQADQGSPRRRDDWHLDARRDETMEVSEGRTRSNSMPQQFECVSGTRTHKAAGAGMDLT